MTTLARYMFAGLMVVGLLSAVYAFHRSAVSSAVDAAVSNERRERLDDGIELIRRTDKLLDVTRKASDSDLCLGMGGTPEECKK
jgi:hypothetical protein